MSVPVNGPWDLMAILTGNVVTVVCCFVRFIITAVCRVVQNKQQGSAAHSVVQDKLQTNYLENSSLR